MREPAAHSTAEAPGRSGEPTVKMEPGTAPREHARARPAAGDAVTRKTVADAPPSYGQPGHVIRDSIPGNYAGLAGGALYADTARPSGMGNTGDAHGAGDKALARQNYPLAESGVGYEPAPAPAPAHGYPHPHPHPHQHQSQLYSYQPHHRYQPDGGFSDQPDRGFSAEADTATPAPPAGGSGRDRSTSPDGDGDGSVRSCPWPSCVLPAC